MTERVVVLLSGGLDSAVVAAECAARGVEVHALTVDYGQTHWPELHAVDKIADVLSVATRARVTVGSTVFSGALVGIGTDVVVPGRNALLLSLGVAHAHRVNAQRVLIGACIDDRPRFADCRPAFIESFQRVVKSAALLTRVEAPLIDSTKAGVIKRAVALGRVDLLALTWSCYTPGHAGARAPRPCGACLACVTRAKGFAELGMPDPALSSEGH